LVALPASAQQTQNPSAMEVLVKDLMKKGAISQKDGQALLAQLHAEAAQPPTPGRLNVSQAPNPAPNPAPAPADPNLVRVPYVSPAVREQIKQEVKDEVVDQAKRERWAQPFGLPAWLGHITFFGDLRLRDESHFFDKNNSTSFVNVNAIDQGAPYNVGSNNNVLPPIVNTTQNRNFTNYRARFGFSDQIDDDLSMTIRLASGNDNQPVTTNQTMGNYYNKDQIWLDQAYLSYTPHLGFIDTDLNVTAGRMAMPFVRTDLVWDSDVNPDGIAVSLNHTFLKDEDGQGLNIRLTGAAMPLSYVSDSFPTDATSDQKAPNDASKYILAAQLGLDWTHGRYDLSFNTALYDYHNVAGKLSAPCSNEAAYCNTDDSIPGYMQQGNTLFGIRNFTFPDPSDVSEPQYFGLASPFHVLDMIGRASITLHDDIHLSLLGDFADNLAYSPTNIQNLPIINNNEECSVTVPSGQTCAGAGGTNLFQDGNQAWLIRMDLGYPEILKRWQWSTFLYYEHIDPDAVLDAFNDQDFHLGGTNAKGWVIGGNIGLFNNTWASIKWFSTDEVTGPKFAEDTLQVDLNTRF
jgi:hypothetical protein